MIKFSNVLRIKGTRAAYQCQGCDMIHMINVLPTGNEAVWGWDQNMDAPTFTPSVLVRWSTLSEASRQRNEAFFKEHGRSMTTEELPYDKHHVCHTFIRGGMVEFLPDSTHQYAGQTLPLPPLPEWLLDLPKPSGDEDDALDSA